MTIFLRYKQTKKQLQQSLAHAAEMLLKHIDSLQKSTVIHFIHYNEQNNTKKGH